MRISFDLDDTLIPSNKRFPLESKPFLLKIFKHEPLRLGTKRLFKYLKEEGHDVYIYTTSLRSKFYIKSLFIFYGIRVDGIINQMSNLRRQQAENEQYSKNPQLFGIDLHVDDLQGVKLEASYNSSQILLIEDSNELDVERIAEIISKMSL